MDLHKLIFKSTWKSQSYSIANTDLKMKKKQNAPPDIKIFISDIDEAINKVKQNDEPKLIMGALMEIRYIFEVASLINGIDSRNYLGIMYISYRETINLDPDAKQKRIHNPPYPPKKTSECPKDIAKGVYPQQSSKKEIIRKVKSFHMNQIGKI
ncbi:unnamed protein product [Rangifer tarandus platyrhynchus]|uniref:Uncharacterized protein n=2 Tax=Rangifer tarandus platyrhynchus TaxID=3082113 RepID=A0ABN8ZAV3_RANTA|nr:unnamed protein product [Rangifer tarandus platyrhynchus]CAI9703734.1 unnamed protein product [Rangifer tarandus platyrhynchus]